jgi:DNA repair exonuclease SbcCD ATPase subunit
MNNIAQLQAELDTLDAPNKRKVELQAQIEAAKTEQTLNQWRKRLQELQTAYLDTRPGLLKAREKYARAKTALEAAKSEMDELQGVEKAAFDWLIQGRLDARLAGMAADEARQLTPGSGSGGNE